MRETRFIGQNKGKWRDFERLLDGELEDPEKLSDLFIQVTDDLSYSRTFYPNRSVRVYLNGLAQRVFLSLHRGRRSPLRAFLSFWTEELPKTLYQARRDFRLSFLLLLLALGIGALSSAMDPEFLQVMLGEGYVRMTEANIDAGDPMAVYKSKGAFSMALGITANNLYVAFLTFIMGAFFMVGTMGILIRNGIMVGAFQYFFIDKGLFRESFLTIWTHGTLEVSAIVIAGAAGLTMGRGLTFPGALTRLQAFQHSARRGLTIMLGIFPVIVLAGFIEGYLTRHTDTPDWLRGTFIGVCLLFILAYYVWYPRLLAQRRLAAPRVAPADPPHRHYEPDLGQIKHTGALFSEIFQVYSRLWRPTLLTALAAAAFFTAAVFVLSGRPPDSMFRFPSEMLGALSALDAFFFNPEFLPMPLVMGTAILILVVRLNRTFLKRIARESSPPNWWVQTLQAAFPIAFMFGILAFREWYVTLLIPLLFPLPLLWLFVMQRENGTPWQGLNRTLTFYRGTYGQGIQLLLLLLLIGLFFFMITDSLLLQSNLQLINWVILLPAEQMEALGTIVLVFSTCGVLFLITALIIYGFGLLYYSLLETQEAPNLKTRIRHIRLKDNIRGLERENPKSTS